MAKRGASGPDWRVAGALQLLHFNLATAEEGRGGLEPAHCLLKA